MDQNPRDRGNLYISESWSELKLSREIIILLNLFYKKNSKESIYIHIYWIVSLSILSLPRMVEKSQFRNLKIR